MGAVENLEHIIRQLEGISEHISALMLDRHAEALAAEEHKARTAKFRANDKPQSMAGSGGTRGRQIVLKSFSVAPARRCAGGGAGTRIGILIVPRKEGELAIESQNA